MSSDRVCAHFALETRNSARRACQHKRLSGHTRLVDTALNGQSERSQDSRLFRTIAIP